MTLATTVVMRHVCPCFDFPEFPFPPRSAVELAEGNHILRTRYPIFNYKIPLFMYQTIFSAIHVFRYLPFCTRHIILGNCLFA